MRITQNRMTPSLNRIVAKFDKLPNEAYVFWKKITPRDTGNAKRRTRLQGSKIKANYQYAVPLDRGHSNQAPRGMSGPTDAYIKKRIVTHTLRK
tara:strand:- start:1665 stop:1946 length:282 start_codon:yes stop_codon:yes gene_type:complete